jgi:hypothetical protein
MEGEEVCFWFFFFDLEGIKSFASGIKTNVVHSQKIIWWVGLFLEFLKIVLRREARPQGIE